MSDPLSPTSSLTSRRRRRRLPTSVAAAACWATAAAALAGTASALVATRPLVTPSTTTGSSFSSRSSVIAFFRDGDHEFATTHSTAATASSTSSPLDFSASSSATANSVRMPAWLSIEKSHLSDVNVRTLADQMRASHLFTESETRQLLEALYAASHGDDQILAGAAEFVGILVHMELGTAALAAAAYHFAACVHARRTGSLNDPTLLGIPPRELQALGPHAAAIARDAARLKQLEVVAARVAPEESTSRGWGVRPNTQNAGTTNLRQLLLSEASDWRGLAIRCAASLYRLRGLQEHASSSRRGGGGSSSALPPLSRETIRAAREALHIYAPLASRLGMRWLKNELENAAFQLLYRRQYHRVQSFEPLIRSMGQVLDAIKAELTDLLLHDEEFSRNVRDFTVTARVKEPYSLWNKMLRHRHHHIRQVPDALALRIVLNARKLDKTEPDEVTRARERALCYYAQALCTQRWKPSSSAPRFKDYIERPKPNGYQSLHYTAQNNDNDGDNGWALEFQVRTGQMHQIAEFGLASHWDYKAQQHTTTQSARSSAASAASTFRASRYPAETVATNAPTSSSTSPSSLSSSSSTLDHSPDHDHSSDAYLRKVQEWHWQQRGHDARPPVLAGESYHPTSSSVTLSDVWQSKRRQDRIRDRAQRLEPYLTALTEARSDLNRDYVFVFLTGPSEQPLDCHHDVGDNDAQYPPPGGRVLALPSGACVLDALREGERAVGHALVFARQDPVVNGVASPVTRQLHNGDVLSLPPMMCSQQQSYPHNNHNNNHHQQQHPPRGGACPV